jgi:manganese/zinc/iron transport system permease protein
MGMDLFSHFTDPILRAPTIGCILMCVATSLAGVVLLFQKKLLISETISHAAYPGAIGGIFLLSILGPEYEWFSFLAVLVGALFSSWLGLQAIRWLERKWKIPSDAALCFVLAAFFGTGVLLASGLQQVQPMWAQQGHILLFGQAATLTDEHIVMYGLLSISCFSFILLAFRPLQAILFDRMFAQSVGIQARCVERIFFWLLLISIVTGIRSVGVILISGMLIAPAVAARQFSNHLQTVFGLAALFGALSGWIGGVLAAQLSLPTGPMIVLVGAFFALMGLLGSPKRGILFRLFRQATFRLRCMEENVLKGLWKKPMGRAALKRQYPSLLSLVLFRLVRHGWIVKTENAFFGLTDDGRIKANAIVRLHRLWELYLTEQMGRDPKYVHASAEEMEHVLTPEIEERLTKLLSDPQRDPHEQPIPARLGEGKSFP